MPQSNSHFAEFLAGEVRKYQGVCVPLLSAGLRRALVHRLPCKKLHPNPEDEFCDPKIGPNYEIISHYREEALTDQRHNDPIFREPMIVERMKPDGYMLLNGHHRWAAAVMMDVRRVNVRIVNATRLADIKRVLNSSRHEKRATMDLEEVVFQSQKQEPAEKRVPFPLSLRYPQRLRLGIPALISYLDAHGYDVWVYSSHYYSSEYIRALFRLKHVHVAGLVTGSRPGHGRKAIENEMKNHYHTTLSIDRESLLRVNHLTKAYEEYPLDSGRDDWSAQVIDRISHFPKEQ